MAIVHNNLRQLDAINSSGNRDVILEIGQVELLKELVTLGLALWEFTLAPLPILSESSHALLSQNAASPEARHLDRDLTFKTSGAVSGL